MPVPSVALALAVLIATGGVTASAQAVREPAPGKVYTIGLLSGLVIGLEQAHVKAFFRQAPRRPRLRGGP